jgi:hypothetical protein
MCLSDFISSTTMDYIGIFALAVFNVEQEAQRLVQIVRRKKNRLIRFESLLICRNPMIIRRLY